MFLVNQGRRTVQSVISKCFLCKRFGRSKPYERVPSAPLPSFRVKVDFPFANTGVDYLGLLLVKNIFGEESDVFKVHIVLYTCACSRAVHLDLVPDTTCIAFVRSLNRFIGRYGIPKLFISDNATCFLGPEL